MYSFIAAGGSGTRVLEALVHLCAIGMGPPRLRLFVIETDAANGSLARARALISTYDRLHRQIVRAGGDEVPFFRTGLELVSPGGDEPELPVWSPARPGESLEDVLAMNAGSDGELPPEILDLFFTRRQQTRPLDQGCHGDAAVGAAVVSFAATAIDTGPWRWLMESIHADLTQRTGSRVFLAGSVFGGTGSAALHSVATILSARAAGTTAPLRIGAAALAPYFQIDTSSATEKGSFPLSAASAAAWYQQERARGAWPFDAMYWIGDRTPRVLAHAPWGREQANPAHVTELIASMAALDFLDSPVGSGGCFYAGPRAAYAPELGEQNPFGWEDLPMVKERREACVTRFREFLIVALVHLGFSRPLLANPALDRRPGRVPWYARRFARRNDWLTGEENARSLTTLAAYFEQFFIPWVIEVLGDDPLDPVRLANRAALREVRDGRWEAGLDHLGDLDWSGGAGARQGRNDMDLFFTDLVHVARSGSRDRNRGLAAYLELFGAAAHRFAGREYPSRNAPPEKADA